MRVIAIANQKGGCGKTTTSINFAACLARLEKNVLLIDLDPQGHSTCGLGVRAEKLSFTLYDLLSPYRPNRPSFSQVVYSIHSRFSLLPAHNALGRLEEESLTHPERNRLLCKFLRSAEPLGDFHYLILDCPPNLGVLTYNALEAADEVIIPIEPSFFSLHGLAKMMETLEEVSSARDRELDIYALLTIFNARTCFAREVYEEIRTHFQERLFRTIIHESVILKEAAGAGKSVADYAPDSQAYRDYFHLAVEYLEREWDRILPTSQLGWQNWIANQYGPRRVIGGILFQFWGPKTRCVELAGDFNSWIAEPLVRSREQRGLWQKVVPVVRGGFRYKFIVDGEWQVDPYQPQRRENAFGSLDSYLEVG